jgi:uncharacterized protein YecT (DUF1311 family)
MTRSVLIRIAMLAAAAVFLAAPAQAQCEAPKTDAQRAQCLGDELRGSDRTINRVYGELMKSLSPADQIALRGDERTWLRTRDRTCSIISSQGDRDRYFADLLSDYQKTVCVVRLTNERVSTLNTYQRTNAVAPPPVPPAAASPVPAAAGSGAIAAAPVYDVFSREPRSAGKWYFEVKIEPAGILKTAEAALFAGIMQAVRDDKAANASGESIGTLRNIRRIDKNLELTTLGFAVDLDDGKLYTSESGEWRDGRPGSAGGSDILRGRSYRMMLSSSVAVNDFLRSGALAVNLGESGFVYAVPAGYRPLQPR